MTERDDIAAAVTLTAEINGQEVSVTGHPVQPDTIGPFDAWAVWVSTRWLSWCVREHTYNVVIALPAGHAATFVPSADDVVEVIGSALYAKGMVPTLVTPVQVLLANEGPMPAVQIQVTI